MARILFGLIVGVLLGPIGIFIWYSRGKAPVAVSDPPLPYESTLTQMPLHKRIDKEMIQMPAVQASEATYVAGAKVYAEYCGVCHGFHGKSAPLGERMYPAAPPLWEKHRTGPAVGVSDDAPGETHWKVANGIRLTGMPEFRTLLSDEELWQVSVLLSNADKPLPPSVLTILRGETGGAARVPKADAVSSDHTDK